MALLAPQPCAEALASAWKTLVVVVRPRKAARSKATETLEASNILGSHGPRRGPELKKNTHLFC